MAARKSTGTNRRKSTRSKSASTTAKKAIDFRHFNGTEAKKLVKKVQSNPKALYLAGGIGALVLARFAFKFYKQHPEIKEFIKDNIDTVESTLKEYRQSVAERDLDVEARH